MVRVFLLLCVLGGTTNAHAAATILRNEASYFQQHYHLNPAERSRIATLTLPDVLQSLRTDRDYTHLVHALLWLAAHPDEAEFLLPYLPSMLQDATCVGLTSSADLIIRDRILTHELVFWGHGGGCDDDLFQVAGRASWLLKELTGQDFGSIRLDSTSAERVRLQEQWREWLRQRGAA